VQGRIGPSRHLVELCGVGPVIAGRILAEVETSDRFPSENLFVSYYGTAPIDAFSGDQLRHRLFRTAGNRRINHALHVMVVTQIHYPASPDASRVTPPSPRESSPAIFTPSTPVPSTRSSCGSSSGSATSAWSS
jgi:hypothetical protein